MRFKKWGASVTAEGEAEWRKVVVDSHQRHWKSYACQEFLMSFDQNKSDREELVLYSRCVEVTH